MLSHNASHMLAQNAYRHRILPASSYTRTHTCMHMKLMPSSSPHVIHALYGRYPAGPEICIHKTHRYAYTDTRICRHRHTDTGGQTIWATWHALARLVSIVNLVRLPPDVLRCPWACPSAPPPRVWRPSCRRIVSPAGSRSHTSTDCVSCPFAARVAPAWGAG